MTSAATIAPTCTPIVDQVQAARAPSITPLSDALASLTAPQREALNQLSWTSVTLPDNWSIRWPDHTGSVWYRVDWHASCAVGQPPPAWALGIDSLSMAGAVYLGNGDLLWRDAALAEPLSRSWNLPHWWVLPASSLQTDGHNQLWIRVVGVPPLNPGLGVLRIGAVDSVARRYQWAYWHQHTNYFVSAVISAVAACLLLTVWLLRRRATGYLWFALMSLSWTLYMTNFIADSPWPLASTLDKTRMNVATFVCYVLFYCMFNWRFALLQRAWPERLLQVLAGLSVLAVLVAPEAWLLRLIQPIWAGSVLAFVICCLLFLWQIRHLRELRSGLLAACWLSLVLVGIHDLPIAITSRDTQLAWAPILAPIVTLAMTLILAVELMLQARRIERFSRELGDEVQRARQELAQALAQQHGQALDHAKLQERVQIARDLHDGLGGSVVRSIALVEHAQQPLSKSRVLSMLKVLRDDLRQVIDNGASADIVPPATPKEWIAPLRHRFTRVFDELGMAISWTFPPHWRGNPPSILQCMAMARVIEEALANVIKHSKARHVQVRCRQDDDGLLTLVVADDGVGFDSQTTTDLPLGVGLRSMRARMLRIGGRFSIRSSHAGCEVEIKVRPLST